MFDWDCWTRKSRYTCCRFCRELWLLDLHCVDGLSIRHFKIFRSCCLVCTVGLERVVKLAAIVAGS